MVTCCFTKLAQDRKNSRYISRAVGVSRVAGSTDKTVFGKRTRCPSLLTLFSEPLMGRFIMDMHRISQGNKQFDIEKIGHQGNSSRSWLTNSKVTIPASGWIGNIGRPCFLDTVYFRVNDFRARSDRTWPTVVPRCRAISLAARRTSSSISRVVRMGFSKTRRGNRFWVPFPNFNAVHQMFDDRASQLICQVRRSLLWKY